MEPTARFREQQYFRQRGMWVLIAFSAGVAWYGFYEQILMGRPIATAQPVPDWLIWVAAALVGIAVPILFFAVKLTVQVTDEGIRVRFFPLVDRLIPHEDIRRHRVVTYDARREYGGWGIKWVRSTDPRAPRKPRTPRAPTEGHQAYTAKGDQGVQLDLVDGEHVLIGARQAPELDRAIKEVRARLG